MYEAYHRFLRDYCAPYPDPLTSVILVSPRDVMASVAEVRRCGRENWPVGIYPICPPDMSLDDPNGSRCGRYYGSRTSVLEGAMISRSPPPSMRTAPDTMQRSPQTIVNDELPLLGFRMVLVEA
jgi:hypothetical protein